MQRPTLRSRSAATIALMAITLHVLAGDADMPTRNAREAAPHHAIDCTSQASYQHLTFQPMQQDSEALGHLLYRDTADHGHADDVLPPHPCGSGMRTVVDQTRALATPKPCTIQRDVALQSHFMMLRLCREEAAGVAAETTSQHARQSPSRKTEKMTRAKIMPAT